jgi:hypothetical protein
VGKLSAYGEYKITYAQPKITIPGGTGHMNALDHHIAFGFAIGFTR